MKKTITHHTGARARRLALLGRRLAGVAVLVAVLSLAACRDDEAVVQPDVQPTETPSSATLRGMYVLNEGNMGANKATLDYLDLATGLYSRNIYPSRNPSQTLELGDVGNDIKVWGSRLWMVINCSNKVEVASAATAVSVGRVGIPNCRSLAFDGGHAYVSSYVGKVNGASVLGAVYRVDTVSLQVTGKVTVGYQPEEMAIVDGKLYVANSGGYNGLQGHGYDRRVSVVDLATFTVTDEIDVAPNLFRLRADRHGQLWVTSQGDYKDAKGKTYVVKDGHVADSLDLAIGDLCIVGDSLYYYTSDPRGYGIIDVRTHRVVNDHLIGTGGDGIRTPYGIIVNPETRDVYLMDATNYVSSGWLYCFDSKGSLRWRVATGDIPGHACFTTVTGQGTTQPEDPSDTTRYLAAVDEYVPAPGQFVNLMPEATSSDTPASMARKCTEALADNAGGTVSLGGFGGYITFHFHQPVANLDGNDFLIRGNYHEGASEPGIVMVSQDENGNGLPDDTWYELSGSADEDSVGKVVYGYSITYTRTDMQDVPWRDSRGQEGSIRRNGYHTQEYFPLWLPSPLTFTATLLPPNGHDTSGKGTCWVLDAFRYGYADNAYTREGCSFDISRAVDSQRRPVALPSIDFIRVYSAENQQCGWLGETSTEITGAELLHFI